MHYLGLAVGLLSLVVYTEALSPRGIYWTVAGSIIGLIVCAGCVCFIIACCLRCYICCIRCFEPVQNESPRPPSTTTVMAQTTTTTSQPATAYPLQQPANSNAYSSELHKHPLARSGKLQYSSDTTAPQAKKEPGDNPPAYPGFTNHPSAVPPVAMNVGYCHPVQ